MNLFADIFFSYYYFSNFILNLSSRASRSLNNNIESAQHEAMIATVFCDEVNLTGTGYIPNT